MRNALEEDRASLETVGALKWPQRKGYKDVEVAARRLLEALHGVSTGFGFELWRTPECDPASIRLPPVPGAIRLPVDMDEVTKTLRHIRSSANEYHRMLGEEQGRPSGWGGGVVCQAARFIFRRSPGFCFSQTPTGAFGRFAKRYYEVVTGSTLKSSALDAAIRRVAKLVQEEPQTLEDNMLLVLSGARAAVRAAAQD